MALPIANTVTAATPFPAPQTAEDRRRLPRMRLECDAAVRRVDEDGTFMAYARTLSGSGMMLETDDLLPVGARLEVTVRPHLAITAPLRALLEVVRCEAGTGEHRPHRVAGRLVRML